MTLKEKLKGRNLTNLINNKTNQSFQGKQIRQIEEGPKEPSKQVIEVKYVVVMIVGLLSVFFMLNDNDILQLLTQCNPNANVPAFEQNNKQKFLGYKQLEHSEDWNYYNLGEGAWVQGHCLNNDRPSPMNLVTPSKKIQDLEFANQSFNFVRNNVTQATPVTDNQRAIQMDGHFSDLYIEHLAQEEELHYKSLQFHFHAPAEHQINGIVYDLEMHIVHKLQTQSESALSQDQFAVIGYFFQVGKEDSPLFDFDNIDPSESCQGKQCEDFEKKLINFGKFEDLSLDNLLHYKGSLTTPPCSPVVSWYLNPTPLKISREQLTKFKTNPNLIKSLGIGNHRDVQGDVIPSVL